jgi:hypothetical protein
MKNKFLSFNHQGMSGIIAPLETNDKVSIPGEQIDNLSFTFISPLGTNNNNTGHLSSPFRGLFLSFHASPPLVAPQAIDDTSAQDKPTNIVK